MAMEKSPGEHFLDRLPHWFRGAWGEKFARALGDVIDTLAGRTGAAYEATRARYVDRAPDDALPYAAEDVAVPRFIAGDSMGEFRARCKDPWGFHSRVGTEAGAKEVLEILGFDPDKTFVVDISLGESWCHEAGWWSFEYLVSRDPLDWGLTTDEWDAGGPAWDTEPPTCWDVTAHPATFTQLGPFLWKYKAAPAYPLGVVTVFGDGELWDEGLWNGGTWNGDADDWDEDQADTTVLALPISGLWDGDLRPFTDTFTAQTWDQEADTGATWSSKEP